MKWISNHPKRANMNYVRVIILIFILNCTFTSIGQINQQNQTDNLVAELDSKSAPISYLGEYNDQYLFIYFNEINGNIYIVSTDNTAFKVAKSWKLPSEDWKFITASLVDKNVYILRWKKLNKKFDKNEFERMKIDISNGQFQVETVHLNNSNHSYHSLLPNIVDYDNNDHFIMALQGSETGQRKWYLNFLRFTGDLSIIEEKLVYFSPRLEYQNGFSIWTSLNSSLFFKNDKLWHFSTDYKDRIYLNNSDGKEFAFPLPEGLKINGISMEMNGDSLFAFGCLTIDTPPFFTKGIIVFKIDMESFNYEIESVEYNRNFLLEYKRILKDNNKYSIDLTKVIVPEFEILDVFIYQDFVYAVGAQFGRQLFFLFQFDSDLNSLKSCQVKLIDVNSASFKSLGSIGQALFYWDRNGNLVLNAEIIRESNTDTLDNLKVSSAYVAPFISNRDANFRPEYSFTIENRTYLFYEEDGSMRRYIVELE